MRWYDLAIDTAKSHPARGAWIEIEEDVEQTLLLTVAPRKGCVD